MSEGALRRVARAGDGWHPTAISPDELRTQRVSLHAIAEAAGRDLVALDVCMRFNIALNSHEPDVLDATVDALARDLLPHFP